ncbi:MAG: tripartite tricarboxylate transporter substrate binding protein [Atribacterota bacterium]|nr:tripartite tricarboxylate transporter substrate binding protein [Atribacterota bacterium]
MKKLSLIMIITLIVSLLATSVVLAADWPERSPTCVVGFAAGGGTDTAVRPFIAEMEKYLERPITVVNMDGASSAVACEYVLERPADGYWWFATGNSSVAVTHQLLGLVDTTWEEWETLFTMNGPDGVVVRSDSEFEDIEDLIEYMQNEETIIGVTGVGTSTQIYLEEFAKRVGAKDRTWVPHGGCHPTAVAVLRGEVKFAPITLSAGWEFIESGDLKVLTVFGVKEGLEVHPANGEPYVAPTAGQVRSEAAYLDDLIKAWPIFVKRDIPVEIRDKIREAFIYACEQPSVQKAAEAVGLQVSGIVGEEADRLQSIARSNWAWLLYEAGEIDVSPAEYGIPRPEDWTWPPEGWDTSQYPMKGEK